MADLRFAVAVDAANVRATASTGGAAIGTLARGAEVVPAEGASSGDRWIRFRFEGRDAFISGRVLTETGGALAEVDDDILSRINERLVAATGTYDGIAYKLGCKAVPRPGGIGFPAGGNCTGRTVDCFGWIAAALAYAAGAGCGGGPPCQPFRRADRRHRQEEQVPRFGPGH